MLPSKRDLFLGAALVCLAAPCTSIASADSPEAVLNRGLAELLRQTKGRNNSDPVELAHRLRPTIERFFNMESLTRKALGVGWKDFSPAQQKKAVDLFSEIIIRSYTSRFDPSSEIDIQFVKSVDLGNGRKEVPATARYQGNSVMVAYRVENTGPEGWRVYDVVIEGVSLASNYRAQFDGIRQKGGPDA
ncbi:MAG: ABC transporter substrate-binding protein, partial [Verrucomicrobia bacterium]|nr:ABC transporter substrate-binding protein [Verrucomicrobiota bacterium]